MVASRAPRVFVNVQGRISRAEEAKVSAMDHGFLYGDSVYETVRTLNRVPFLLGRHLDRLQRSMDRIFLTLPMRRRELDKELLRSIKDVPIEGEMIVRIVLSRGVGPLGLDITLCDSPCYLFYLIELVPGMVPDAAEPGGAGGGVAVVISKIRRNSPRALDPSIKSGNFLNNILGYKDARDAQAHEAILCTAEGYLAEGSTSNVFVVKNELLWTPRAEGILDGITRAVIFEEANTAGLSIGETNIPPEALFSADEAFITSSVKGIVPVTKVNDKILGSGRRGPITHQLQELYQRRMEDECRGGARSAARLERAGD